MARGVEKVEGNAGVFEGHRRSGYGNAALTLDLHPVGTGAPLVASRLDCAGKLDGSSEEQQLFGERGLTCIRVGDDGEGSATRDELGQLTHGRAKCGRLRPRSPTRIQ